MTQTQVGITVGAFSDAIFNRVREAGHVPHILSIEKGVDSVDLTLFKTIIFSGGADISPKIYGEKNTYSSVYLERDIFEVSLLKSAINKGLKIIGICRGHQLINAVLGGTLIQDFVIEGYKRHCNPHPIELVNGGGVLKNVPTGRVNSIHHQAVKKIGDGLIITSMHKEVIESTESKDGRIITVQCHPELFFPQFFTCL